MIDPCHKLLVVQQARLLDLSRSSVYCLPKLTPDADLLLMRRMDELHLEYPFAGARMLCDMLLDFDSLSPFLAPRKIGAYTNQRVRCGFRAISQKRCSGTLSYVA